MDLWGDTVVSPTEVVQLARHAAQEVGPLPPLAYPAARYVTALLAPSEGDIEVDAQALAELGVTDVRTVRTAAPGVYDAGALVHALRAVAGEAAAR